MALKLTAQVTQISYCIAIPLRVFRARFQGEEDNRTSDHIVRNLPDGVDRRNVEWSGHYGANVFFTAENDAGRDAFVKMLEEYLSIPKYKLPKLER